MDTIKLFLSPATNGNFDILSTANRYDILRCLEPVLLPNSKVQPDIIHTKVPGMEGVALCFMYQLDTKSFQWVTKPLCKVYGFDIDELLQHTDGVSYDFLYQSLDSVLGKPQSGMPVYLLTNKQRFLGAGLIASAAVRIAIRKAFGNTDYYVLPSSIHEVLVAPADAFQMHEADMVQTVKEINKTVVTERDFLADHVYKVKASDCSFSTI